VPKVGKPRREKNSITKTRKLESTKKEGTLSCFLSFVLS